MKKPRLFNREPDPRPCDWASCINGPDGSLWGIARVFLITWFSTRLVSHQSNSSFEAGPELKNIHQKNQSSKSAYVALRVWLRWDHRPPVDQHHPGCFGLVQRCRHDAKTDLLKTPGTFSQVPKDFQVKAPNQKTPKHPKPTKTIPLKKTSPLAVGFALSLGMCWDAGKRQVLPELCPGKGLGRAKTTAKDGAVLSFQRIMLLGAKAAKGNIAIPLLFPEWFFSRAKHCTFRSSLMTLSRVFLRFSLGSLLSSWFTSCALKSFPTTQSCELIQLIAPRGTTSFNKCKWDSAGSISILLRITTFATCVSSANSTTCLRKVIVWSQHYCS